MSFGGVGFGLRPLMLTISLVLLVKKSCYPISRVSRMSWGATLKLDCLKTFSTPWQRRSGTVYVGLGSFPRTRRACRKVNTRAAIKGPFCRYTDSAPSVRCRQISRHRQAPKTAALVGGSRPRTVIRSLGLCLINSAERSVLDRVG